MEGAPQRLSVLGFTDGLTALSSDMDSPLFVQHNDNDNNDNCDGDGADDGDGDACQEFGPWQSNLHVLQQV